jgi:hypothetical protein
MLKKTLRFSPYLIIEFIMNEGDVREFDAGGGMKRKDMSEVSLYTEGAIDIIRDNKLVATRQAGDFSGDRPDIPAGRYQMIARTQPARLVCIGKGNAPNLQAKALRLSAGEGMGLNHRHNLYLAVGSASVGDKTFKPRSMITGAAFVLAQSDLMGVVVWSE